MTGIKGKVIDAETQEPLPFVNITFLNSNVGTETDLDGNYSIETMWATDSLAVSYLGYVTQAVPVKVGEKNQVVNFELSQVGVNLNTVTVTAEKKKYRKKDNPAVELIRNVIDNKDKNRLSSLDYYEYEQYEKTELDLNNITDKFRHRKAFRKIQFIFDYVDTSEVNGKPYLPLFLRETASRVFYRKDPEAKKEYRDGIKITGFDEWVDPNSISTLTDLLYQDVNVYDNIIMLMGSQFISPTNSIAPDFYKFYILDTLEYEGHEVIDLAFYPRNKLDLAFKGNLYITHDSSFAVVRAEMDILPDINLNFVRDLHIEQEFSEQEGAWLLTEDYLVVDYSLTEKGQGLFGQRTVSYRNHVFNQPREEEVYSGADKVVEDPDALKRDPTFWAEARHQELSSSEAAIYEMVDTLQTVPAFRRFMDILTILVSGYKTNVGPFDIGPIGSFYSFNDVEGFRLRFGGKTNFNLSEKWQLAGYLAYGFRDHDLKYTGTVLYSFRPDFMQNPKHYLRAGYQKETNFVGQHFRFISEDNFFLSFRRGGADRMTMNTLYQLEYLQEFPSSFSYGITLAHKQRVPIGTLTFEYLNDEGERVPLDDITTAQVGLMLRFAPNEQYVQGQTYRINIQNRYPIFTLNFQMGLRDVLGGQYDYQRVALNISKRFNLSLLGYTRFEIEGGKVFGEGVPYILLNIPRTSLSYAFAPNSFNMMNALEFVSDEYVYLNLQHFFNGFFFNKIPLIKKLKLREIVTLKAIYGRLSDANNPLLNPELIQFITDSDGKQGTFTLGKEPYLEASAGVSNIFKVGTIDFVWRLNYLDLPAVPQLFGVDGLGLRFRAIVEF